MTSSNRIYAVFIVLALLYWNPASYYLIYDSAQIFSEKTDLFFYWIYSTIFACGLLFIILLIRDRVGENAKNIVLAAAFSGIIFSALVTADGIIGMTLDTEASLTEKQVKLIFEPNSKARHRTSEFDYTVDINSLGLRDREINREKGDKFRILTLGDSFTYGWGVNVENSWPKKLEQYLLTNGFDNVEVINAGKPGIYTRIYKNILERAAPVLNPDLVLVGVNQMDDLAQSYKNPDTQNISATGIKNAISVYLKHSFKNILLLARSSTTKTIEINADWESLSRSKIDSFNDIQRLRFENLDDTVRQMFVSGNLNPHLLYNYIIFPDKYTVFNNPDHPATRFSIQEMTEDFKAMKEVCDSLGSRLVFINIPRNQFTGHVVVRTPHDALNPYFEKNNRVDSIYRSIADANILPYIELTRHFIDLEDKSKYFFKYDGHPNESGHEELAINIGRHLIELELLPRDR